MNPNKISPDDPRLTAYALGEMAPEERAAFEAQLAGDPEARQAAEDIRALAGSVGAALGSEPLPAVEPLPASELRRPVPARGAGRLVRFPQLYYVVAGLAAACFGVFFVIQESKPPPAAVPAPAARAAAKAQKVDTMMGGAPAVAEMSSLRQAQADSLQMVAAEDGTPDRFVPATESAESNFPLHVGHESYLRVRAQVRAGVRPSPASVQVGEMVNAFTYRWPAPAGDEPVSAVLEEAAAPWAPEHRLVRIGLKGRGDRGELLGLEARVRVVFNPGRVQAWRLIGFGLAGGAPRVPGPAGGVDLPGGMAVTVLYEIVPAATPAPEAGANLLTMTLAYLQPADREARVVSRDLPAGDTAFAQASADFRFAATVAAFGSRLQGGDAQVPVAWAELAQWATASADGLPDRLEFAGLVPRAASLR